MAEKLIRRNFDISFNELYDMYKDGELVIRPEFQRLFRWSHNQQSLFIESLLLDMPIPPIYVDEQLDGSYVLVDGLQRVSSYLNFRGIDINSMGEEIVEEIDDLDDLDMLDNEYEDYADIESVPPGFKLSGCEIINELNGLSYEELDVVQKRHLKRIFIRVEVLTKENPKEMKYHMFKRLNSGGALLSKQELRNSNIRMIDETFINFINELSMNRHYVNLTSKMNKEDKKQMKRSENILRYFIFKNKFLPNEQTARMNFLDDELTTYLEEVSSGKAQFNYETEKSDFEELVRFLDAQFSSDLFSNVNRNGAMSQRFIQYNFDGFMQYFSNPDKRLATISRDDIKNIKINEEYRQYRTGGLENVRKRIEVIDRLLSN